MCQQLLLRFCMIPVPVIIWNITQLFKWGKRKTCTSSITNLGEATLIDIPFLASASSTSS